VSGDRVLEKWDEPSAFSILDQLHAAIFRLEITRSPSRLHGQKRGNRTLSASDTKMLLEDASFD